MRSVIVLLLVTLLAAFVQAQADLLADSQFFGRRSRCIAKCLRAGRPVDEALADFFSAANRRASKERLAACRDECAAAKPSVPALPPVEGGVVLADIAKAEANVDDLPDGTKLWARYRTELANFLRQGKADVMPYLQLVPLPLPAEWDSNPQLLRNFADRIPRLGPIYDPRYGYSFETIYREFLNNIVIPQSALNAKSDATIRAWEDRIWAAEDRVMEAEFRCMDRYNYMYERRSMYSSPTGFSAISLIPPMESWMQMSCFTSSSYRYYQDQVVSLRGQAERDRYALTGPYFDLLQALDKFGRTNDKQWTTTGSLARFAQLSEQGQTNSFQVKISSRTKVTEEKFSSMNFGVSYNMPAITLAAPPNVGLPAAVPAASPITGDQAVGAPAPEAPPAAPPGEAPVGLADAEAMALSADGEVPPAGQAGTGGANFGVAVGYQSYKLELSTSEAELQINFGAGGYKYIPIEPSREWFDEAVLVKYKNGPFKKPTDYFSEKGKMPAVMNGIYVVSKPKLEMFVSQQDSQSMEKASQLKASLQIYGVKFDFGKDAKLKTTQETAKLFKVTIEGADPTPQIVAVNMQRL